jgi:dephospho-CoA kinase
MRIIGITGRIGSGKTMFANSLKYEINQFDPKIRIDVIEVEKFFKTVAVNKKPVKDKIEEIFGKSCFLIDGNVDVAMFANIVDYDFHTYKNSILPLLNKVLVEEINSLSKYNYNLVFVDYNHLFHSNFKRKCNEVIYVDSEYDYVVNRLSIKREIDLDRIETILSNSIDYETVKKRCKTMGMRLTYVDSGTICDYSEFSKSFMQEQYKLL